MKRRARVSNFIRVVENKKTNHKHRISEFCSDILKSRRYFS